MSNVAECYNCSFLISSLVGILYLEYNHWTASNAFGIAFSISGIELLSLGSYWNSVVLLVSRHTSVSRSASDSNDAVSAVCFSTTFFGCLAPMLW